MFLKIEQRKSKYIFLCCRSNKMMHHLYESNEKVVMPNAECAHEITHVKITHVKKCTCQLCFAEPRRKCSLKHIVLVRCLDWNNYKKCPTKPSNSSCSSNDSSSSISSMPSSFSLSPTVVIQLCMTLVNTLKKNNPPR